MKSLYIVAGLAALAIGSLEARDLAKEIYDQEVERLNPLSAAQRAIEEHLNTSQGKSHFTEESPEAEVVAQPDEQFPSLNDYLTDLQAQDISTDNLILINSGESMSGKKFTLNPEVMKKIDIPEEEKKLSWWDEVVDFFDEMFS